MEKTPQESKEGATKGSAGTDVARSKKSKQKRAPQADVKLPAWRQATLNGLPWVCFAAVSSLVALRTVKGGPLAEIAQRCTTLAYPTTDADGARKFERGMDDAWLVAFLMCMLITLRGLLQNVVFHPMAKAMGVTKPADLWSFKEMGWQWLWYSVAWVSGVYLVCTEWDITDTKQLWEGYPHKPLSAQMKLYYLTQLAFWLSMIIITLLEKWRKDFVEMMLHHFITSGLVGTSYVFHFTRVGTAILAEQDLADILLPMAKMFKYADWKGAADAAFAAFALLWIPTRHGIFLIIYWSLWTEAPVILKDVHWNPAIETYWGDTFWWSYMIALGVFQCLMLFWLKLLLAAVYRALSEGHVEDQRSDDEDDGKDSKGDKKAGNSGGKGKGKNKNVGKNEGKKEK